MPNSYILAVDYVSKQDLSLNWGKRYTNICSWLFSSHTLRTVWTYGLMAWSSEVSGSWIQTLNQTQDPLPVCKTKEDLLSSTSTHIQQWFISNDNSSDFLLCINSQVVAECLMLSHPLILQYLELSLICHWSLVYTREDELNFPSLLTRWQDSLYHAKVTNLVFNLIVKSRV